MVWNRKDPERINSRKSDDIDFQLQTVLHALRDGQFSTELENPKDPRKRLWNKRRNNSKYFS